MPLAGSEKISSHYVLSKSNRALDRYRRHQSDESKPDFGRLANFAGRVEKEEGGHCQGKEIKSAEQPIVREGHGNTPRHKKPTPRHKPSGGNLQGEFPSNITQEPDQIE